MAANKDQIILKAFDAARDRYAEIGREFSCGRIVLGKPEIRTYQE